MDEFPDNSHKAREGGTAPEKNIKRVIEGKVVQRKPPMLRRFSKLLVLGDPKTAVQFAIISVVMPAAKAMLADAFQAATDRMLYGDDHPPVRSTHRSTTSPGYVAYNRISSTTPARREEPRRPVRQSPSSYEVDLIVVETRADGEALRTQLFDCIESYASVSVAELYEMAGIEFNFNDHKWGWTDVRGCTVTRTRDGLYQLNLPRPEPID